MTILKRTLTLFVLLTLFTVLLTTTYADNRESAHNGMTPVIQTAWRAAYPDSTSDDAGCQLCHQNSFGGDGWNAYGRSIQEGRDNGLSSTEAILALEALDSDGNGMSNLDEIMANAQPGWTDGAVNLITFNDGTTSADQSPPAITGMIDATGTMSATQGISDPIPDKIPTGETIVTVPIANGLMSPVLGTTAPTLPDHLFVVDQIGIIYIIDLTTGTKSIFLDVSDQLNPLGIGVEGFENFDERGLLGLAFHPDYATNGRLYTYQSEPVNGTADFSTQPDGVTADHQSVLSEWLVAFPSQANAQPELSSKRVILRLDEPQFNHNGGDITFGPDGMLYVAVGDGGGADDTDGQPFIGDVTVDGHGPDGNGQNATNPYGTILRIDPTGDNSANGAYGVPSDNPFVGDATMLDEIYAYGLRNAYRISFDTETGNLYAGDVGQNAIEEVDLIVGGGNYGWKLLEGTFAFDDNGTNDGFITTTMPADLPGDLIPPIAEYDHDEGLSVIGGYVYRGTANEDLIGRYIFGDWSTDFVEPNGRLFYLTDDNSIHEFVIEGEDSLGLFVHGFGQDANGEVYVLGNTTGTPSGDANGDPTGVVLRIDPTTTATAISMTQTATQTTPATPTIILITLIWALVTLVGTMSLRFGRKN